MAIARDQTPAGQSVLNPTTFTITWTTNPAPGAKVLLFIGSDMSVTSVTDNGTTPRTFTDDADNGGASGWVYIWRADSITLPATGQYAVTVVMGAGATLDLAAARSYTGVATGGPVATNTGSGSSTTVNTGNVTPTVASSLVFGGFIDDTGNATQVITLTTSGGNTIFSSGNGNIVAGAAADNIPVATTATSMGWTISPTADFGAVVAVYSPAAAAGVTATLGSALPPPSAGLSGAEQVAGALAVAVPPPVPALAGAERVAGALAAAVPPPVPALTGAEQLAGVLGAAVPPPAPHLSGGTDVHGALAAAVPPPVLAASGGIQTPVTATLGAAVPPPVAGFSASAAAVAVTAQLAAQLAPLGIALQGQEAFTAQLGAALAPLGAGLAANAVQNVSAVLGAAVPPPAVHLGMTAHPPGPADDDDSKPLLFRVRFLW